MKYFTSDTHFGHANILHLGDGRPFDTIEEHNEYIRNQWSNMITPNDEVYVLGDIALGKFVENIHCFDGLPGKKYLVPGNHDRLTLGISSEKYITKYKPYYLDAGFEILPTITDVTIDGQKVLLSHYPYRDSRDRHGEIVDKYASYSPVNEGLPLLHGHTHQTTWYTDGVPNMFHVGVDSSEFTPIPETRIIEWLHTLS